MEKKAAAGMDGWDSSSATTGGDRVTYSPPSSVEDTHSHSHTRTHITHTLTCVRVLPSFFPSLLFLLFEESCVIWHRNCRRRRCHITRRCSVRLRGGKDDSFAPRVPPLPPLPSVQKSPLYHFFSRSMGPRWPRACPAPGVHLAMWATRCDILESDIVPGFAAICHHAAAAADHDDAANVL